MPKLPEKPQKVTKLTESHLLKAGFVQVGDSWHHPSNLPHHAPPNPTTAQPPTRPTNPNLDAALPDAVAKCSSRKTLAPLAKGKEQSKGRIICRITRFASSFLDADNFAGGCKGLIDQLRYAKLIPDDNPASIELQFRQHHAPRGHEGTMVEIIVD